MEIFSLLAIGLVTAIFAIILAQTKQEYAMVIAIIGAVVILMRLIPMLQSIIDAVNFMASKANISTTYVSIVLKSAAVACLTSICSALCKDAGQGAIAAKLEFAGRITIIILSLPAVYGLFDVINKTI